MTREDPLVCPECVWQEEKEKAGQGGWFSSGAKADLERCKVTGLSSRARTPFLICVVSILHIVSELSASRLPWWLRAASCVARSQRMRLYTRSETLLEGRVVLYSQCFFLLVDVEQEIWEKAQDSEKAIQVMLVAWFL
jgi:hypothetical protein